MKQSKYVSIADLDKIENDMNLNVLHLNIQGLASKYDKIRYLLQELKDHQPDILILCETFLTDINCERFSIPSYNEYHKYTVQSKRAQLVFILKKI